MSVLVRRVDITSGRRRWDMFWRHGSAADRGLWGNGWRTYNPDIGFLKASPSAVMSIRARWTHCSTCKSALVTSGVHAAGTRFPCAPDVLTPTPPRRGRDHRSVPIHVAVRSGFACPLGMFREGRRDIKTVRPVLQSYLLVLVQQARNSSCVLPRQPH
ncbi:uncharacterized protein CC84DRAFT_729081 [Paraphaeosphaeria sporulosa]|uniref:Uncharacterized protein n=1 Tax=Paraphaeosphaeria sporulosa TaxID=1460663 RepID=A0A177CFE1_9PLEO|nr:uncharacterized protein CC84DRAFT_729081 [Paraphaeosphaeria sporulosa]OAG05549.1 hypothetical protein CC84DRAFT_729081 [Paraphaeosphaeria sporulosa]